MINKWLYIQCIFFAVISMKVSSEELFLGAEKSESGLMVYVENRSSAIIGIANTLNLRGKGSSISPVMLHVENFSGKKYEPILVVDPADESTCLSLRPSAIHGIIYKHEYIKMMFNLESGTYRIKATYDDLICDGELNKKIESRWIEIRVD